MFETIEDVLDIVTRALVHEDSDSLYLVGGAVRDELALLPIKDLDFTTNLTPEVIHERFSAAVLSADIDVVSVYDVGISQGGTVGAIVQRDGHRMTIEVTPMRTDTYPSGDRRRPSPIFTDDIIADLGRRDFTINALAYDLKTGHVLDPFHGLKDMQDGILRTVGNADERFDEDAVRVLRAARFLSRFELKPDINLIRAVEKYADKVVEETPERIFKEFTAVLEAEGVFRGLTFLYSLGVLELILPEVTRLSGMPQPPKYHDHDAMMHTFYAVHAGAGLGVSTPMRWALLLHDTGKYFVFDDTSGTPHFYGHEIESAIIAKDVLKRFNCSNRFVTDVSHLVGGHMKSHRCDFGQQKQVRRFVHKMDLPDPDGGLYVSAEDFSLMAMLDTMASNQDRAIAAPLEHAVRVKAIAEARSYLPPQQKDLSPLTGEQIMQLLDIGPGPEIGDAKKYLIQQVVDGNIPPGDGKTAATMLQMWFYDYNLGEESA